jgi:hypothetical protein
MPQYAWYVLIGVGALAVLLALWKGRGLVIGRDRIEVRPRAEVKVAEDLHFAGGQVGNVIGVDTTGGAPAPVDSVAVLSRARITGVKMGDIVGYQAGARAPDQK